MKSNRKAQIEKSLVATKTSQNSTTYGLILSTLGRQGSPKILDNLMKKPAIIQSKELKISLSIGGAMYPDDATDSEKLIHLADKAMYKIKKSSRGQFGFYSQKS
jgi:GGDEF domain-containing protein